VKKRFTTGGGALLLWARLVTTLTMILLPTLEVWP
jgi:hypothetical protein